MARKKRPVGKRVRRGARFWRDAVARQAASGLAIRVFCEREGLSPSTFSFWRRKLAAQSGEECSAGGSPSLVPVSLVPGHQGVGTEAPYELVLGDDLRVRVPRDFDEESLHRLLAVLGSVAC